MNLPKFLIVVSDPATGKTKSHTVEGDKSTPLLGKAINDVVDGTVIGLPKKEIRITGGTDKDGFPMLPSVHGGVKGRITLAKGRGFQSPKRGGQRRAKTIRGKMITEDTYQINAVLVVKKKIEKEKNGEKKTRAKKARGAT